MLALSTLAGDLFCLSLTVDEAAGLGVNLPFTFQELGLPAQCDASARQCLYFYNSVFFKHFFTYVTECLNLMYMSALFSCECLHERRGHPIPLYRWLLGIELEDFSESNQ